MTRIAEYRSNRDIQDTHMGKHEIHVDIDVKAGSSEDAMEKANIIEEKVNEALNEINE